MKFDIRAVDGVARRGTLALPRGVVETPAFMPVGTTGAVRSVSPAEVRESRSDIILGNTFHLMLRPGSDVIRAHGDLHKFMGWDGPILTDSGGFQVWSLADKRRIDEAGVTFRSPVNGAQVFLGPEESIRVQHDLGSDIWCLMSARRTRRPEMRPRHPWSVLCAGRPAVVALMFIEGRLCLELSRVVCIWTCVRRHSRG